jgi:hypothetical protein
MPYGYFILLALVLGVIAAIVTFVRARKSKHPPGGVHPGGRPGSGSSP